MTHFSIFAKIYGQLADYRYHLMSEAEAKGYPVIRSLAMHFGYDPITWSLHEQYLFGSDFLIAPVMDPGKGKDFIVDVKVYIPASSVWIYAWNGKELHGGKNGRYVVIPSKIGQPPVFYKIGSNWGNQLRSYLVDKGLALPDNFDENVYTENIESDTFVDYVTISKWVKWLGIEEYVSNWRDDNTIIIKSMIPLSQ
jgi:alpha-glucosidase (family GH31 glycosyl hydrolase)